MSAAIIYAVCPRCLERHPIAAEQAKPAAGLDKPNEPQIAAQPLPFEGPPQIDGDWVSPCCEPQSGDGN